jgi:hypothetical protein
MRAPKDQSIRETKYNNKTKMKKSQLKELIKEAYLEYLREEDDEDIEDEMEDDFEAEPAVAQDGESKNQESAPRKRINFENRELEMLVDVNKNATKKGIKIQFLSDDELSKEERTKLVSSLQTYLDEGLAKFVKGAKLNVDSDQDVPNKTKTVGFTIKIGDIFGLVSKVFANRGDDEEGGEEVEADETEETEELQELRKRIRGFLKEDYNLPDSDKEVVLSNEILNLLQERGVIDGEDAQKVHEDLIALLKEKLIYFDGDVSEDFKPSTRLYDVIDAERNVIYPSLSRAEAIEKSEEKEEYKFTPTSRLSEDLDANTLTERILKKHRG